jgi:Na+-transporting NADH:ubiquinone oxidoreductase subunit B
MGATSALLILIGGLYLFVTGTASRTTILSVILSYAVLAQILHWAGVGRVPPAWIGMLGGGFFLGAFFMATDPVSSPRTEGGRVLYGILIGISTVVIRYFSVFNGGLMFAILLGNMFAPILDVAVNAWGGSKIDRAKGGETVA